MVAGRGSVVDDRRLLGPLPPLPPNSTLDSRPLPGPGAGSGSTSFIRAGFGDIRAAVGGAAAAPVSASGDRFDGLPVVAAGAAACDAAVPVVVVVVVVVVVA